MIPIVELILRNKVRAVEARLWTWEVTTTFDEELREPELLQKFAAEFPETSRKGKPIFKKMISFNGAEGRKHRYLVMHQDISPSPKRLLPRSLWLYGKCDDLMRKNENTENLRFAFLWENRLYILVFMEGRLCHWSEEMGHDENSAQERLSRFDEFLSRDELFSRVDQYKEYFEYEKNPEAGWNSGDFWCGCHDPFWRKFSLNKRKAFLLGTRRMAVVMIMMLSILGLSAQIMMGPKDVQDDPEKISVVSEIQWNLPERKMMGPEQNRIPAELKVVKLSHRKACGKPHWKLGGIVENRIAQVITDGGKSQWIKPGDSLQEYRVQGIGRSQVSVICGSKKYDVENGR